MERLSTIKWLEKRFSDKLCDLSKPWSDVKVYFPIWLRLIKTWKEINNAN